MDWFRLEGISFTILSEAERNSVVREWVALLSSSGEGVVLARGGQARTPTEAIRSRLATRTST